MNFRKPIIDIKTNGGDPSSVCMAATLVRARSPDFTASINFFAGDIVSLYQAGFVAEGITRLTKLLLLSAKSSKTRPVHRLRELWIAIHSCLPTRRRY
jgi:hypothetical protein